MRFPKTIRFRKAVVKIYGKTPSRPSYRVCGYVAGKRRMSSHATYSEALQFANKLARDIAAGNQSAALNVQQSSDALAALERLQSHFQATGRRLSLLGAVSSYVEADLKLAGRPVSEAIDGFLSTVATVKRMDIGAAAAELISQREASTRSCKSGKRPPLSLDYHGMSASWLREFADSFPGYAVCDLTKAHVNLYMTRHGKAAPKTRNARRGAVRMFLKWCVENDYISASHRLLESTGLKHESCDPEEIACYRPAELASLLSNANADFLPLIALAGLAGIRWKEICRLQWEDVFRIPGHVEINAKHAKTRSRRLVPICPALAAWLEPYRDQKGPLWARSYDQVIWHMNLLLTAGKIPSRRNGLRHSFISAHFALHSNEGLTAQQAGNSPTMIFKHYNGLFTKGEAEKWFAVVPETPSNVLLIDTPKETVA